MMVNFLKENPLREEYPFTIYVGPTFSDTWRRLETKQQRLFVECQRLYHFNIFSHWVLYIISLIFQACCLVVQSKGLLEIQLFIELVGVAYPFWLANCQRQIADINKLRIISFSSGLLMYCWFFLLYHFCLLRRSTNNCLQSG